MTEDLTRTWLPKEIARELDAIANGSFEPITRGKGRRERLVQEWLCLNGHRIAVDRDYGPATATALDAFRSATGIQTREDQVDAETLQALLRPMMAVLTPLKEPQSSLGAAVVAYAKQHLAQHPVEVGGENKGPWVRLYMNGNEGKDWPWCAGFITFVLRQACETLGHTMPIKGSFSCDTLAAQAKKAKRFVRAAERAEGNLGSGAIFLNRRTSSDWTHTGLVADFSEQACSTIEGNTNDEGSREGYEVCARTRGYGKMDFIRID